MKLSQPHRNHIAQCFDQAEKHRDIDWGRVWKSNKTSFFPILEREIKDTINVRVWNQEFS